MTPSTSSDPTRCLWLTKGLGRGGVERLLLDMYPLVDHDRFTVDVAYVLPWKHDYHQGLEDAGASVFCLGSDRGARDPRWLLRLQQLLRRRRYDVVHTHAPVPAVAARLLGVGGPAVVHTEHNMWDRYRLPTRLANSLTYRRNGAVVAVSDVVADSIRPRPPVPRARIRTIHHGTVLGSVRSYDDSERLERRRRNGLPVDRFLIGNVGNFTAKKDHRNLIEAMARPGHVEAAHLVLIGLGPLEATLRAAADDLGIADRVTFLGSRSDVFELLPLLDLFCLSSEFEGFPIALVEAMASGLPCVATAVGGIPEIIVDGDSGLLVPSRDAAALADAIGRAMDDPDLRAALGDEAKKTAEGLDLRNAVDELQSIYRQLRSRR